jgi:hypothetical protein
MEVLMRACEYMKQSGNAQDDSVFRLYDPLWKRMVGTEDFLVEIILPAS